MPVSSPSRRILRVRELLKHEIAEIIRREFPLEQVGLLTVNAVGVARDLRSAVVFVGFVGNAAQRKAAEAALTENTKLIQGLVGGSVRLKFTPRLHFRLDDSIAEGSRIIALLEDMGTIPDLPASPDSAVQP